MFRQAPILPPARRQVARTGIDAQLTAGAFNPEHLAAWPQAAGDGMARVDEVARHDVITACAFASVRASAQRALICDLVQPSSSMPSIVSPPSR